MNMVTGITAGTRDDMAQPGEAASRMLQLLNASLTTQALYAVAELGIADHLADAPVAVDDLAIATGAHRLSLYRLLRMLVGVGVFREEPDGRFALTPFGAALRSDGPESVRDYALYVGAPEIWAARGRLLETVMTGKSGFMLAHGMSTYEYQMHHPALGSRFERWMTRQSDQHNAAVVAAYDFSKFRTVADVGGGQGSTLAAILQVNPTVRGILFDQPQVVAGAESLLRAAGVAERCEVVGGDMLRSVPAGADVYILKRVMMDWGDAPATNVLKRCAAALPEQGRVLVIEMVMPQGNDPSPARNFDLLMMLANEDGGVRTEAEFRDLFAAAGLQLTRVIPTASPNFILEGRARIK